MTASGLLIALLILVCCCKSARISEQYLIYMQAAATSSTSTAADLTGRAAPLHASLSAFSTAPATSQEVRLSLTINERINVSLRIDNEEQHAHEKQCFEAHVSDLHDQLADTKRQLAASDNAHNSTQRQLSGVNSKLDLSSKACKATEEKLAVSEAASRQKDQMIIDLQAQLKATVGTPSKVSFSYIVFPDEEVNLILGCVVKACMLCCLSLIFTHASCTTTSYVVMWQTIMHS